MKKNGTDRLVINYRTVNNITVKKKFPIPRIDDFIELGALLHSASLICLLGILISGLRRRMRQILPSGHPLVCIISEFYHLGSAMLLPPFSVLYFGFLRQ